MRLGSGFRPLDLGQKEVFSSTRRKYLPYWHMPRFRGQLYGQEVMMTGISVKDGPGSHAGKQGV